MLIRTTLVTLAFSSFLAIACGDTASDGDQATDDSAELGGASNASGGASNPSGGTASGATTGTGGKGNGGSGGTPSQTNTTLECGDKKFDFCADQTDIQLSCRPDLYEESEREGEIEQCRTRAKSALDRIQPCFLSELLKCNEDTCDDDECVIPALLAIDPTQGDPTEIANCKSNGSSCNTWPRGDLAACRDKFEECKGVDGDECYVYAALKPEYKTAASACFAGACSELSSCLREAIGTD